MLEILKEYKNSIFLVLSQPDVKLNPLKIIDHQTERTV